MNNINRNILVIDDSLTVCLMLKSWLVKRGFNVEKATNVFDAKQKVREYPFDLILTDIRMPDADGFSFLCWIKKYDSDVLVIMMTGYADIESAVESMKLGAADYISKPIEPEQLFKKIEEAFIVQENLLKQNRSYDDFIKFPGEEYKQLYEQLDHTVEHNKHQLIIGERGTGKMSVVKYIYEKGISPSKPLVIYDNDKPDNAIHFQRGSSDREAGEKSTLMRKFREAEGGVLYIRQLEQLNIDRQDELLDILTKQKKDDTYVQVIMSTDIAKEELEKQLIPKLYHLIEKSSIILPTLKGKKEVITFLADHFLRFANDTLDKQIDSIDPVIQEHMAAYAWPGNIQELKNCILKAALLTEGTCIPAVICSELFDNGTKSKKYSNRLNPLDGLRKENYEKEKIMEALELAKGNKTMAASILNIDRKTLYNKIKLYNVITHS